jgi:hypothetical protein
MSPTLCLSPSSEMEMQHIHEKKLDEVDNDGSFIFTTYEMECLLKKTMDF